MKANVISVFYACSLLLVSQTAISQNQEWLINSSSVKFKIKNAGFNVDGSFKGLAAKLVFDPGKSYGNAIDATVDARSINTGIGTRDGHLRKSEYFNVAVFPNISMKATLFGKEADGSFRGHFKLTVKDKTKDLIVPFTFTEKDGKATFSSTFIINRLDFSVGESSMVLSNNVTVTIEVNATKK